MSTVATEFALLINTFHGKSEKHVSNIYEIFTTFAMD